MDTLCISITYLDDRFHGQTAEGTEWPPSPWRLYQALLNAAAGNRVEDQTVFAAFEQLPPPVVLAPAVAVGQRRKTYVPNNASDVQPDRQARLTDKDFNPVLFTGPTRTVHYLWAVASDSKGELQRLCDYARMLTAVGLGIDLVAGNGLILSQEQADNLKAGYPGQRWKPAAWGDKTLRCPCPGSYANLKACHASALARWDGPVYTPAQKPTEYAEVGYAREGKTYRPTACFTLLRPGSESRRMASFDPRDTVLVSAWVRSRLCELGQRPGVAFLGDPEEYIAGHVAEGESRTPPRFSYLPLPSIGHAHADGLIRRFILAEPYGGDGQKVSWAGKALQSALLKNSGGDIVAELSRTRRTEKGFKSFTESGKRFRTVTPVILPGFDGMKYAKAEKLLLKAVRQAGFSPEDITDIHLRKAPFQTHAYHPKDYKRAKHFENYSAMHVELAWKHSVPGPLALGAGRHRGLGLFFPLGKSEVEP